MYPAPTRCIVAQNKLASSNTTQEIGPRIFPLEERASYDQLVQPSHLAVVISRSHSSPATNSFTNMLKNPTFMSIGSSLKFMMLWKTGPTLSRIRINYGMGYCCSACHFKRFEPRSVSYGSEVGAHL